MRGNLRSGKSHASCRHRFRKAPFSKRLSSTLKRKPWFSDSVDGWPNRKNKAAFSNISVVVWTGPNIMHSTFFSSCPAIEHAFEGTVNVF